MADRETTTSAASPLPDADDAAARRRHFGAFYGDTVPPEGFGLVIGNCQAESIRVVVDSPRVPTIRVPPVHELTASDARRLHDLLPSASFLVSQPARDDYHDLPLGTRQLRASLRSGVRALTITPIRFAGLYPFQAAIRLPGIHESLPLVDYHDVRDLAAASGLPLADEVPPNVVHAIANDSLGELRSRETKTDVPVSDLFESPSFSQMRTVNHPGNAIFLPVGERIIAMLGVDAEPIDPGRPLLSAVEAPREEWVVDAWGSGEAPRSHWTVAGQQMSRDEVREAHLEWYAQHPRYVAAAVERLKPLLTQWRLT